MEPARATSSKCFVDSCDALISVNTSFGDQISGNQIDGATSIDAQEFTQGSHDGIVLTDVTGDVLSGNTIQNVWDTVSGSGNILKMVDPNGGISNFFPH